MKRKLETKVLRGLMIFGFLAFFQLIRKPPMKDWNIVFLLKSYVATFLDTIVVRNGYIKYPVTLFKSFDISVIFSYLLFPVTCVYFNQLTKHSRFPAIFLICTAFSLPMALVEHFLERNTKLIDYKRNWNWLFSLGSIFGSFIGVRFLYKLISYLSEKYTLQPTSSMEIKKNQLR
ncbi:CBO0543 family protein [Bacillus sp. Marseille-Q1617]|uniref:CBO0543 family protein n=1 Tax=Bacillus sp. Marseille-Q1617 TaxID=2736887 RepID=UPI00158D3F31|nr:CBO0543 family protein [Bacillus sp. Marseille-Q1617]